MMALKYLKYCTLLKLFQRFTYLSKTKKEELSVGKI
jgi:hypothetical protein